VFSVGTVVLLSLGGLWWKAHREGKPMELTELELVRAIRKVLSGDAPGVVVAVGDDAAVIEPGRHQGVLTADMLVEGVHFELGSSSALDLG
jgi:thiamine-monophosphate kinase